MLIEEIQQDIRDMSDEDLLDMVRAIRKSRAETPVTIQKKRVKKTKSKQDKLLAMLDKGTLTIDQLLEKMNESKEDKT